MLRRNGIKRVLGKYWSRNKKEQMKAGKIQMKTKENYNEKMIDILREELIPAMGCTEPIAVAYCAALAREHLGEIPENVCVEVSGNIVKNVKSVIVPNTGGMKGIEAAAAAGIMAGEAAKKLEVISKVTPEQKAEIEQFLKNVPIQVNALEGEEKFDIVIFMSKSGNTSKVRIKHSHTNVVLIEKNGKVVFEKLQNNAVDYNMTLTDYSWLTVENIFEFACHVDLADISELLDRQIEYNTAISEEGLSGDWGANIGKVLLNTETDSLRQRAKAAAAAGSDARMSGCEMPVIINSGSGNQGMTVSLPVITYARGLGCSKEKLYRALIISNLIAIHQKKGIGCLSAYCGAVSAGAAAGCGIAYLYSEDLDVIVHTLVNALAITSGIVCDGAKPSCAAKVAMGVDAGILGYEMYVKGQQFRGGDGIVSKGVENTINNVSRLSAEGMKETDKTIISMMI